MCNKVNGHLINIYSFFSCAHLFTFKMLLIFSSWNHSKCWNRIKNLPFSPISKAFKQCRSRKERNYTPKSRKLVCSMIMISENATPKTLQKMNLWHNCKKQECHDIILQVICNTNMISVNAGVSQKGGRFLS